jgi:hypothetical protein
MSIKDILDKLNELKKRSKTIGNYFLIKNSSIALKCLFSNE